MSKFKISALFFFLFFLINVFFLPHYGINWDEPNHFLRGQAFLHYYLYGKKDYSNLPKFEKYYQKEDTIFYSPLDKNKESLPKRSIYQTIGYEFKYWVDVDAKSHPPLSGIMAAFFNYIFFQKLGLINDVDSYHMYAVFTSAILVAVIFFWVSRIYGLFAGLIAMLSLILYPLFFSELHFNIKDVPETVFYSLTLITYYGAITRRSIKWMLMSAFFFGISFSTKLNIVFALLIMGVWFLIYLTAYKNQAKKLLVLLPSMVMIPVISFIIFIAFWPAIWQSPIKGFLESVLYYKSIGTSTGFDPRFITIFNLNTYPSLWILFTTPIVVLFFSFLGFIYVLRNGWKEEHKTSLLILLWLIVPVLRVTIPNASIYGGVRQIMEYIPAMAILAGIGAKYIISLFHCHIVEKFKWDRIAIKQLSNRTMKLAFQFLIVLSFIPISIKLISIHPNEGVYFNSLIGGLKGAKEKDIPYWGESLGNPYKQGLIWLNKNAEKNSKLVLTYGMGSNLPSIFIRPDIEFHNGYRGYDYTGEEYAIGLTNKSIYENSYYLKYLEKFLIPVYEVKVDSVPIMKIWKNDLEHTKPEYRKESYFAKEIKSSLNETNVVFDLGEKVSLRKLKLFYRDENCLKNAQEISLQTSIDQINWENPENEVGKYILEVGLLNEPNTYNYYFAGTGARYIKINFKRKESCLNNLIKPEIYIL